MATANLDAGPILAPTGSSTAVPASTTTAQSAFPGTSGDSDAAKHNTKMSNLYLVTFLATLFILLLISAAIVMRSYVLRRRYQRRLDEALASGLVLAPRAQGGKRKRFGAKPGLFEVYLREPTHPTVSEKRSGKYGPSSVGEHDILLEKNPVGGRVVDSLQWGSWETIIPLSAQPIFVKRKYRDIAELSSASPGRLVNIHNPDVQAGQAGLSILTTRPPPSRFLNLFGINSEAYSVAYQSAQNAGRERQVQEESDSEAPRLTPAQTTVAARTRRLERLFCEAWGIGDLRPSRRTPTGANANANTAERTHAPAGYTGTPTPEQGVNYELQAVRMQDELVVFGTDSNPPPPVLQTPVSRPEGEGVGTVVVQMADGTRAVGIPVPLNVPAEDSDSEDERGTDVPVGGRAVRGQRQRPRQTTEQSVVLDAEFGVASASAAPVAATAIPPATVEAAFVTAAPSSQDSVRAEVVLEHPQDTQPAAPPSPPTSAPPAPPAKIRVEMLQIAVLIAMPTPHRKSRCRNSPPESKTTATVPASPPARPHPRASLDEDLDEVSVRSGLSDTDGEYADCAESFRENDKGHESDEDDDDDGGCDADRRCLPEVVLGVARVQYSHPPIADANLSGGVVVSADVDDDDMLGVTASGTRVAMPLWTTVRRPATTTRGGSLGGSAAFGIPG